MLTTLRLYSAMLNRPEFTVSDLASGLNIPKSAIHTAVRRMEPGWFTTKKKLSGKVGGQANVHTLTPEGVQALTSQVTSALQPFRTEVPGPALTCPPGLILAESALAGMSDAKSPNALNKLMDDAEEGIRWAQAEVEGWGFEQDRQLWGAKIDGLRRQLAIHVPRRRVTSSEVAVITDAEPIAESLGEDAAEQHAILMAFGRGPELNALRRDAGTAVVSWADEQVEAGRRFIVHFEPVLTDCRRLESTFNRQAEALVIVLINSGIVDVLREFLRSGPLTFERCAVIDSSRNDALSSIIEAQHGKYFGRVGSSQLKDVVCDVLQRTQGFGCSLNMGSLWAGSAHEEDEAQHWPRMTG